MDGLGARLFAGQRWWRTWWLLPAVVGVVQIGATLGAASHPGHQHVGIAGWVLACVGPLALIGRRRYPPVTLWVCLLATLGPEGSRAAYLSLIVAFFYAAVGGRRPQAWLALVVGYVSSLWLAPLAWGDPLATAGQAGLLGAWLAVLAVAAEAVRMGRERTIASQAARRVDAERRAGEERLQMARELHDVIGHSMSLISVQAGVGLDLMDDQPEQARVALAAIRAVSRDALHELRSMLATLRSEDEEAPRSPVAGLDRLDDLIALSRAAGLLVSCEVAGRCRPLPTAVSLAAYRIVQESLTNVARHAPGAAATVTLDYGEDALVVAVLDDGAGVSASAGSPAPSGGTGITGMQERAAALDATLTAGPLPASGFEVRAVIPLIELAAGAGPIGSPQ
ncbi:MAG TPA: histidine kinase [Mycobacteriales bacterium]|nr:histidine kinase [Mycobacteriales bacterium]